MKIFFMILPVFLLFTITQSFAELSGSKQQLQLAEQGVVSKNASGENQTTMVDMNGNLKIVPDEPKKGSGAMKSNSNTDNSEEGPVQDSAMPTQHQSEQ